MSLTLITGGARSGKSDMAQRLAEASGRPVLFIVTMRPDDDEVRARINTHRATRPVHWRTIEEPLDVPGALAREARPGDTIVIDCVTLLVSNLLLDLLGGEVKPPVAAATIAINNIVRQAGDLAERAAAFEGEVIAVTNEAGSGIVPVYPLGRIFRDALGGANRALAARAQRVYTVTAGLALELRSAGARPIESFQNGPA